jgi:hypothetical protein
MNSAPSAAAAALAENAVLRQAERIDQRAEGLQGLLAGPRPDDFNRLGELALAAEIDCRCRPHQQFVDHGAHALDPRRLLGVVGDQGPETGERLRDRRTGLVIGREKSVRPCQEVAALTEFEVLHPVEQLCGHGLRLERVSDPIRRAVDPLGHRHGQDADQNQ